MKNKSQTLLQASPNAFVATATLLCAAVALPAHAGRPLQAEDAGVLDPGACEVEGVVARSSTAGTTAREQALQLGCGVGASTQVALAASRATEAGASERGVQFSGKTVVWHAAPAGSNDGTALALAYGLASTKGGGDRWRHGTSKISVVYTAPVGGALTAHANLGHARDEIADVRSTVWALALEHDGFGAWALMAELYGDDHEPPWWNLGLRYAALSDTLFLDLSFGRQLTVGRPRLLTLGFKLAF